MTRISKPADIYPGVPRAVSPSSADGRGRAKRQLASGEACGPSAKAKCAPCSTGRTGISSCQHVYDAIGEIALGELGLDIYPNQIEIITAEQMLDAYSSIGMPLMYRHWSFGKHFARDEASTSAACAALAYELVINSNPCIGYVMEENTMTMQALVIAHAAFGHNHFFKNNYLFQQWTQPRPILDYLFAKTMSRVRGEHGIAAVERILDAAHALMDQGVSRYRRPRRARRQAREGARRAPAEHEEATYDDL